MQAPKQNKQTMSSNSDEDDEGSPVTTHKRKGMEEEDNVQSNKDRRQSPNSDGDQHSHNAEKRGRAQGQ